MPNPCYLHDDEDLGERPNFTAPYPITDEEIRDFRDSLPPSGHIYHWCQLALGIRRNADSMPREEARALIAVVVQSLAKKKR